MLFDPKDTLEKQRQEIQGLLQPIPGNHPAGLDPSASDAAKAEVRHLESLFGECLAIEKRNWKNEGFREAEPVPWQGAVNEAAGYLAKTSKNIILATLIAEAGLRLTGPRGFGLGLEVLTGLVDQYWPNLFPVGAQGVGMNGGDLSSRKFAAWEYAYDWPDRVVDRLDRLVMLTPSNTRIADYTEALKLETPGLDPEIRQKRISRGAKTIDAIQGELQDAARTRAIFDSFVLCRENVKSLERVIQEKCTSPDSEDPYYPPPMATVREKFEDICNLMRSLAPAGILPVEESPAEIADDNVDQNGSPTSSDENSTATSSGAGQMTRQAAFTQLTKLAAFFRQTEPHSPISYAIEQTVRWGKLSLPELLTELIANTDARNSLFERTGLPRPKNDNSSS